MVRHHHAVHKLSSDVDGEAVVFDDVAVDICQADGAQLMSSVCSEMSPLSSKIQYGTMVPLVTQPTCLPSLRTLAPHGRCPAPPRQPVGRRRGRSPMEE